MPQQLSVSYHLASAVCAYFFTHLSNLLLFYMNKGSLCRQFGVILMWFNSLQAVTTSHTDKVSSMMAFSKQPIQKHLLIAMLAVDGEPPLRRSKRKRSRVLPALILHKEVGKGQGYLQSFPFLSPLLRHVQVIYWESQCLLCFDRKKSYDLKGCVFISILYSCSLSQHSSRPNAIVCVDLLRLQITKCSYHQSFVQY